MWEQTDKPFTRRAVKIAIVAACGAGVIGAGTVALAAAPGTGVTSTSTSTGAAASPTTTSNHPRARKAGLRLKNVAHATWVSKDDKTGTFVTHDAIHGTVSVVSATSIQVKAADGDVQTYTVGADTKVHVRADGKGKAGTVSEVKAGDDVIVTGTGTTTLTAARIVDLRK